jgi:RNA polymerase sigma-70 factor (ECF subfamily)
MPKEKNLTERFSEGDPAAFDQIFEKYYRKVYTFSLRNFRNKEDAEGATQEVFYNLWKDRTKLKDLKDLEAWIFSVCLNIIRKHFRKLAVERKHIKVLIESSQDRDYSTDDDVVYKNLLEKTEKIIEKLPPRQKTIFLLSRKEALTNAEISKKLNISTRTVDNQLSRAKSFVRKTLIDGNIITILFFCLFID